MKACLFDIDGTLVQTGGAGMIAFAEAFDELFGVEELCSRVPFAGQSDRGIARGLFSAHGIPDTAENWSRFTECYRRRLADCLTRCSGRVLPGVVPLIDRVASMGDVHVGLLTGNIRVAAELKLSHYRLWGNFAFGGFGDDHPDRNDIAAAAAKAAREAHGHVAERERIVVIGDTPNDIRCARSIGAIAVAVATGGAAEAELAASEPDLLLQTLDDHQEILGLLAA